MLAMINTRIYKKKTHIHIHIQVNHIDAYDRGIHNNNIMCETPYNLFQVFRPTSELYELCNRNGGKQ